MTTTTLGRDTSCTTGLRTGRFATGARLVAEAAYRRLTTPRGTLRGGEDEANYGIDLADLIGSVTSKADAAALPGRIRAELKKDQRITGLRVVVVRTTTGPAVAYEIAIEGQTGEGPFSLAVAASAVSVSLLGIEA